MSSERMEDLPPPPALPVKGARFPDGDDPFWPRIELCSLRERLRLGGQVSEARLALAARCAAINAASEFAHWRAVLRGRGYKRLEDVAGHDHGRALSVCYRRFVEAAVMRTLYTKPGGQVVWRTPS
ncbi:MULTISPECIES: head completion/stabilization protein [Pseudomonas]|uniref:Head completion/stabilization protein n=3 Tax=Pseudomonas TaxID=286 RepID=A0ABR6V2K1_9PSED|nr:MULTISPECIES: head completion/stabilization protein [Pseudomonas]AVD89523.1 phage head protein [Pseudomonas sp. SWI44]MBC3474127.1 head completion/stabilization protein [Pseudomonas taiwanensis]MBC3492280.1 head completion/stabilization protein [Pseudomonas taiwanensis]MDT8924098.1 head completion/stabilization protein [Pseudomonas taiwanensis]MPT01093.1 phage head protein [Pseudomonas sp.]